MTRGRLSLRDYGRLSLRDYYEVSRARGMHAVRMSRRRALWWTLRYARAQAIRDGRTALTATLRRLRPTTLHAEFGRWGQDLPWIELGVYYEPGFFVFVWCRSGRLGFRRTIALDGWPVQRRIPSRIEAQEKEGGAP